MTEDLLNDLYSAAFEDSSVQSEAIKKYVDELRKENDNLKKIVQILIDNRLEKDKNAIEVKVPHMCKWLLLLNEYQEWIENEKDVVYRDGGIKQSAMIDCFLKLNQLREKYERTDNNE